MAVETWKEDHCAVVCCVCTDRGPGVVGGEVLARNAAREKGWRILSKCIRQKRPVLAGSCSQAMQLQGGGSYHYIDYEQSTDMDYRCVCPECISDITAPEAQ